MTHIGGGKRKVHARNSMVSGLRVIMAVIALLLSVSFFISVFYIVDKERRETIIRESETALNSLSDSILSDIERYKEMSRLVMTDKGVVNYLMAPYDEIDAGFINSTRYSVMGALNATTMVDSVFLFRDDGMFIASNRDRYSIDIDSIMNPDWRKPIEEKKGGAVISVNADNAIIRSRGRSSVSIGRIVYDVSSQQRIGMMFMNISGVFIDRKINIMTGKRIVVIGADGTYLSGDESVVPYFENADVTENASHKVIRGASPVMFSTRQITGTPIYIGIAIPIENGVVMYGTVNVIFGLLVVFLISIVIAGAYITRNITNPVSALTDAIEESKEEGALKQIDIDIPRNELGVLKESYNGMVERVNELYSQNLDKEQVIRRAEMRVLQEQIKPHFLYNSLETIGSMAVDAGAQNVYSALETLGSFYRNFLSKGDREIPLAREINIVRDYLKLQKLRYGDIIEDEYDIAPDTEKYIIPKLILQPIVENSIYHGIRLTGEPGTISIKSTLVDGVLHLYIKDTGVGMTEEQIEKLLAAHDHEKLSDEPAPSESFGLWGTIERIRYFCGTNDVVKIRSTVGEFTEIEFIIPKRGSIDER